MRIVFICFYSFSLREKEQSWEKQGRFHPAPCNGAGLPAPTLNITRTDPKCNTSPSFNNSAFKGVSVKSPNRVLLRLFKSSIEKKVFQKRIRACCRETVIPGSMEVRSTSGFNPRLGSTRPTTT